MGENCADRRCIREWDSFTAPQPYSTLCKSKTMKEMKSGGRQKHWQMKRLIPGDINMALNHITEGWEPKHTYAFITITACSSFPRPPHLPALSIHSPEPPLASQLFSFSPASCLSSQDLTLWRYCERKTILGRGLVRTSTPPVVKLPN